MKDFLKLLFLSFVIGIFTLGCDDITDHFCGADRVQVLNGLTNYQSVIGYRRDCGATSDYSVNVSFIRPEMNIDVERGQIFRATHSSYLKLEKVSEDTVKILFLASEDNIVTKVDSMYGVKFIYEEDVSLANEFKYN